jgi:hypothetical protein
MKKTKKKRRNGRTSHSNATLIQSHMDRRMIELEPPRTDLYTLTYQI